MSNPFDALSIDKINDQLSIFIDDSSIANCIKSSKLFMRRKQYSSAIENFNYLIDNNIINLDVLFLRSICFAELKQYDNAIKDLDSAIMLDNQDTSLYHNLGYVYLLTKDYDKAIHNFNKALSISPKHYLSYQRRGICFYYLGNYMAALYDLFIALNKLPSGNDEEIYSYVRIILHANRQYQEEIALLNSAITRYPNNPLFYFFRGLAYACQGQFDTSIDDFDSAIDLNQYYFHAYLARAQVYEDLGNIYDKVNYLIAAQNDYEFVIKNGNLSELKLQAVRNRFNKLLRCTQSNAADLENKEAA